jgi:hypothetical protein
MIFLSCGAIASTVANASAADVPCTSIGGGKFNCSFYPAGNGISGGAPVQAHDGHRVGYLNQGTSFVLCQAVGGEVTSGANRNRYWAYTEANDKAYGWVSAVWTHGGTNDAPYGGVPTCPASRGTPPGAAVSVTAPTGPVTNAGKVPCSSIGGGRFNCTFYPAGDGVTAGAPVQASGGQRVGFLNHGTNFVLCQAVGGEVSSGPNHNKYWAYTEANDHRDGWVNAVWARGGSNDSGFAGVPFCGGAHGNPPSGGAAPVPPTTLAPPREQRPGSVLPDPVNLGSYGTYHFRYQLWRNSTKNRRANFTDWTPAQMMTQLNSNFSHYFTFTGCGRHLHVGDRCSLDTSFAPDGRVEVIAIAPDGFALRSRGGHPEGDRRTIRFQFQTYTNEAEISSLTLVVEAWGPLGRSSLLGRLNASFAKHIWGIFADNVKSRFPSTPPGGVRPCPSCAVSV